MATDPALAAFLALDDEAVAAYADAQAEALGLALPPETRAGAVDNLALLRRQAATFIVDAYSDDTAPPEPFEP
ncbi:AtzG-like protein [Caulobacter sp. LjRoot300]|uniref:AtzG-like protein n=1 Tax=Caulobacter sp. LjRoot300 TaxID=3342321 RepID=UPI003ECC37B5